MVKELRIPAGEFKTKCLKLMDHVQKTKTSVVITKRGEPVAKLAPVELPAHDFFGCMAGTVVISGDIIAPIDVEWEANA
ncbi:MAG: type II toxin-antitoxin system Phd/YefM family antitoxin [Candidatus Melainabacteria bacterium]|nr:type II toxin-antitoxin system Phd/YefM family antitoxin [Candidatus Melainabacteria bacterium]